jgi:hypothetical protein
MWPSESARKSNNGRSTFSYFRRRPWHHGLPSLRRAAAFEAKEN